MNELSIFTVARLLNFLLENGFVSKIGSGETNPEQIIGQLVSCLRTFKVLRDKEKNIHVSGSSKTKVNAVQVFDRSLTLKTRNPFCDKPWTVRGLFCRPGYRWIESDNIIHLFSNDKDANGIRRMEGGAITNATKYGYATIHWKLDPYDLAIAADENNILEYVCKVMETDSVPLGPKFK